MDGGGGLPEGEIGLPEIDDAFGQEISPYM
jgi:hypothetical protein